MSEFKKEAIYVDQDKINSFTQPQANRIEYFQEIVTMYNDLNIDEPLQKNDLTALIENPKDFIAKRLIKEETISIGGLKVNFEKMFDIIEKPEGTENLINKIANDSQIRESFITQRNVSYFEIENGNTVVLNADFLEQTREQSTVYIKTENEATAYKALTAIAENINKLKELPISGHLREILFDKFLDTNNDLQNVKVNPYFGNQIC